MVCLWGGDGKEEAAGGGRWGGGSEREGGGRGSKGQMNGRRKTTRALMHFRSALAVHIVVARYTPEMSSRLPETFLTSNLSTHSTFCPFSQHSSSPRMHISTEPANLLGMLSSNRTKKTHWRISMHSVCACTKGAEFAVGTVT